MVLAAVKRRSLCLAQKKVSKDNLKKQIVEDTEHMQRMLYEDSSSGILDLDHQLESSRKGLSRLVEDICESEREYGMQISKSGLSGALTALRSHDEVKSAADIFHICLVSFFTDHRQGG